MEAKERIEADPRKRRRRSKTGRGGFFIDSDYAGAFSLKGGFKGSNGFATKALKPRPRPQPNTFSTKPMALPLSRRPAEYMGMKRRSG